MNARLLLVPLTAALAACVAPAGMAPGAGASGGVVPVPAPTVAGAGPTTAPPWFRPNDDRSLEQVMAAGFQPLAQEALDYHIHTHLSVYQDGAPVIVPGNVGISGQGIWISELHTHDTTGILHVEAPAHAVIRLRQFFTEWDVPLGGAMVYEDGRPAPDGAETVLRDQHAIAVVYGKPPARINDRWPYPQATPTPMR